MTKTSGPATSMDPRANTVSGMNELGTVHVQSLFEVILAVSKIISHILAFIS